MYQYISLTGGLIVSLFLKLHLNVAYMHLIPLMFDVTIRSNMMSIYLKSFSIRFPNFICVVG